MGAVERHKPASTPAGLLNIELCVCSTSISNNISYGNPGIDQAGIEAAAEAAHCHGFISKLPMGYDTPVGERVSGLP